MTKMSTRILSLILAVFMVVSMVTVFTLPAFAAEADEEEEYVIDYESFFNKGEGGQPDYFNDNVFLIDPKWDDEELVDNRSITFEYLGVPREIRCDTAHHFNNWKDAETSAYSHEFLNGNNIYSYVPVFIFAPGTYTEQIHFPTSAIIIGANAGISPNAELSAEEWTAEKIGENKGWKANENRKTETIFKGGIRQESRVPTAGGDGQPFTGSEDERFAFWLQQAKNAGKDPKLTVVIDGVTITSGMFINHYDHASKSGSTLVPNLKYGNSELANDSRRKINVTFDNCIIDSTYVVNCSNGAHNIPEITVKNSEIKKSGSDLIKRDIKSATFKNVYFHDFTGEASLWNVSNLVNTNLIATNAGSGTYASDFGNKVDTVVDGCVFYNFNVTNPNFFLVGPYLRMNSSGESPSIQLASSTFTHTFNNNIFYDVAPNTQKDYIINAFDVDKSSNVTVNVTNNQFYQSEGKSVYSPFEFTANHKKNNDVINYSGNVATGAIATQEYAPTRIFNNDLKYGITVDGVTLNTENTVVYVGNYNPLPAAEIPLLYAQDGQSFYISSFAGTKYRFEIDNKNVFPYSNNINITGDTTKNVILLSADYGNISLNCPANIYGVGVGINPNDATKAAAENNYDWTANPAFDIYGKTTVGSIGILADIEGEVSVNGVTLTGGILDNTRTDLEKGALGITVKNTVLDDTGVSSATEWFNLANARSMNSAADEKAVECGKAYADSFTLENVRVANSALHAKIFNDYVPANVTVNGLYVDGNASGKSSASLGSFMLGANNKNGSLTVINSNIRNGQNADSVIDVKTYAGSQLTQVTDHKYAVTVKNNIFVNAARDRGSVVKVNTGLVSALNVSANRFINTNNATGVVIGATVTHTDAETVALKNNVIASCNSFTGYDDAQKIASFGFGDADPAVVDHAFGEPVPNGDATCINVGTATVTCTQCGVSEQVAGTAFGDHKWDDGVYNNDATCTSDGTKTQTCTVCTTETQKVTAPGTKLDHEFKEDAYVADNNALCYKAGTETAKCTWCDAKNTRENAEKYPATGAHVFGEYVYDNNATYRADGTKTAKCKTEGCTVTHTVTAEGTKLPAPADVDSTKKFTDVNAGKWYTKAIDHATSYGLVSGVTTTTFGVDVEINRGMFITILARIAGIDTGKDANNAAVTKFTDVKAGKYYAAAIAWANANNIVSGKSETTFEPETAITRQELAVMIVNFAKQQGITLTAAEDAIAFADADTIAKFAKTAVATCQKADIINGYNEGGKAVFKPKDTATRAEAAQMLYKFHKDFYLK